MVTKRCAHILHGNRRRLADEMVQSFHKGKAEETSVAAVPALDAEAPCEPACRQSQTTQKSFGILAKRTVLANGLKTE